MARQLYFRAEFAGHIREFRLDIGTAERLEQRCNAGVGAILQRLGGGYFRAADIPSILKLGLEGAGMPEVEASTLVDTVLKTSPMGDFVTIACATLEAYVRGVDHDLFDERGNVKPEMLTPATSPHGSAPAQDSASGLQTSGA